MSNLQEGDMVKLNSPIFIHNPKKCSEFIKNNIFIINNIVGDNYVVVPMDVGVCECHSCKNFIVKRLTYKKHLELIAPKEQVERQNKIKKLIDV
jgi:predicted membrane protein